MQSNDAQAATVGEYLVALVREVWRLNENFSGKRPFGNSGWHYELYAPLVRAGLVDGLTNEDGEIEVTDGRRADALIDLAILGLWKPSAESTQ
jgi:hypothetical protein